MGQCCRKSLRKRNVELEFETNESGASPQNDCTNLTWHHIKKLRYIRDEAHAGCVCGRDQARRDPATSAETTLKAGVALRESLQRNARKKRRKANGLTVAEFPSGSDTRGS